MANEKQGDGQQSAAERLAAARQQQAEVKQPEAKQASEAAKSEPTDRELEALRLQLQISENNRKAAELSLAAAERNNRDVMTEAIAKEDATVARLKAERERAREWRESGPRKFWVHLAHQLPMGTTPDKPALLIGAASEHEAGQKYIKALGILYTPHEIAVLPAVEGEECPWEEIKAKANAGVRDRQTISLGA